MKKTLKNILGTTLLGGGLLLFGSGCAEMIASSPAGDVWRAKKISEQRFPNDQWASTAVVNRIQDSDGSIVFILDARRIGRTININYADRFLDETKYSKTWIQNGPYGFIITYTPK